MFSGKLFLAANICNLIIGAIFGFYLCIWTSLVDIKTGPGNSYTHLTVAIPPYARDCMVTYTGLKGKSFPVFDCKEIPKGARILHLFLNEE